MGDEVYEVNNAQKTRFCNNPLVKPDIRFYAGAPLQDANGFNLGSFASLYEAKDTI
jgi:hypothetical protein